jgi:hypothetical protein
VKPSEAKAKSQKPKTKSQKPSGHANERFWLQNACKTQILASSKMKQIARKTAPGWKKTKTKKHKYPPFQSPKAGHPSL